MIARAGVITADPERRLFWREQEFSLNVSKARVLGTPLASSATIKQEQRRHQEYSSFTEDTRGGAFSLYRCRVTRLPVSVLQNMAEFGTHQQTEGPGDTVATVHCLSYSCLPLACAARPPCSRGGRHHK